MSKTMRKITTFLALIVIFCSSTVAQDSKTTVDWDKIESRLFNELKSQGGKSDAEIHQAIGYALLEADNQWERAEIRFKKALELDSTLYLSWYCLGLIHIDTEEGNEHFKKAIETKSDFPPPYYWLAHTYCRMRRDKEAIPVFEQYLEVAKGDSNESGRIEVAKGVLQDLRAGREGEHLIKLRKPFYEDDIPFYMVIIGAAKTLKEAEKLAEGLVEKPEVVYDGDWYYPTEGSLGAGFGIYESGLWKGLEPGYFVVADGLFVSKKEAEKLSAKIKPAIPGVYVTEVVNPRIEEILFVSDDKNLVIWTGLGKADFEELHFTNLEKENDILLCSGRRIPPKGKMMMHTFDHEIEPLQGDRSKNCYYFYDNGPKVFYFAAKKPRDADISRKTVIRIENVVRKEIGDPEADVKIRWVIDNKACASVTDPLLGDEAQALTDLLHYNRTLFFLESKNSTWDVIDTKKQAYEVTTVCYH